MNLMEVSDYKQYKTSGLKHNETPGPKSVSVETHSPYSRNQTPWSESDFGDNPST